MRYLGIGWEEVYREAENVPLPDATAALRRRLQQLEIEYIDAAPALQELAQSSAPLYFPTDGHPNAAGYAVFAKLVADYLETTDEMQGIVPAEE